MLFLDAFAQNGKIADSLEKAGRYKDALTYFIKALKENPDNEMYLRGKGFCEMQTGNNQASIIDYEHALNINPKCINCYINMGLAQANLKNFDKAIQSLDKAIAMADTNADAYIIRANIEAMMHQSFAATNDYNKAIALKPGRASYYVQRGYYKLMNNLTTASFKDYDKAISLEPENGFLYKSRGDAYRQENNWEASLKDYSAAIRFGYKNSVSYEFRGAVNDILGHYKEAIADYNTALTYDTLDINIYLNRSMTLYKLEDMDGSCADYNRILDLVKRKGAYIDSEAYHYVVSNIKDHCDPSRESYYYQHGIAAFNTGDYARAIEYYDQGLKKFEKSSMLHTFKGNAFLSLHKYPEALTEYYTALKYIASVKKELEEGPKPYSPEDENVNLGSIYISVSDCKTALGDYVSAQKTIDSFMSLNFKLPDNVIAGLHAKRADILWYLKKDEAAITEFSYALSIKESWNLYLLRAMLRLEFAMPDKSGTSMGFHFSFVNGNMSQTGSTSINFPVSGNQNMPDRAIIALALEDCNKAITLKNDFGKAYLVRGYLKYLSGKTDYCYDYYKAKELNTQEATALISRDCK
jgi:tetratricopeptide (TPR) repeat protein